MTEKKKRGRPTIPEGERKTRTVPFRCQEWLYRNLVSLAENNGRTISQEIGLRLAKSLAVPPPPVDEQLVRSIAAEIVRIAPSRIDVDLIRSAAAGALSGIAAAGSISAEGSMRVGEVTFFGPDEVEKPQAPQKVEGKK